MWVSVGNKKYTALQSRSVRYGLHDVSGTTYNWLYFSSSPTLLFSYLCWVLFSKPQVSTSENLAHYNIMLNKKGVFSLYPWSPAHSTSNHWVYHRDQCIFGENKWSLRFQNNLSMQVKCLEKHMSLSLSDIDSTAQHLGREERLSLDLVMCD